MLGPLDQLGSPPRLYRFAEFMLPKLALVLALLLAWGLIEGLWRAPEDYLQGDTYRIIFVHVPAAWMSLFIYTTMAIAAFMGIVWRMKMTHIYTMAAAPIGAAFTLVTLVTGSIWGKPMWGAWWVWDARLTSELILLFIYLAYIALQETMTNQRLAWRMGSYYLLVSWVNIPIIHYSVEWWNTLHQPASILKIGAPSIHASMLYPLLIMALAFMVLFAITTLCRMQAILLERESESNWVGKIVGEKKA